MDAKRRNIVHETAFIDELSVFVDGVEKGLSFIAGAEDLLSREPQAGYTRDGEVWLLNLPPIGDLELTIYYPFDTDYVFFLAIRPS
jgi:hypothetical protein